MLIINDCIDGMAKACASGEIVEFYGRKLTIKGINSLGCRDTKTYRVSFSDGSQIDITIKDKGKK